MIRFIVVAMVSLLISCAAPEGTSHLSQKFIGHKTDEFFQSYGAATRTDKSQDGYTTYNWVSVNPPSTMSGAVTQNYHTPHGNYGLIVPSGEGVEPHYCEIQIQADKKGIIQKFTTMHDAEGKYTNSLCLDILGN